MEEDLEATQDSGYRVGEKKTIQELQNLDSNDESLRKWKESLGLSAAQTGNDPRRVVVLHMALQVEGRPDMVMDLTNPSIVAILIALDELLKTFVLKEGVTFRIVIRFQIHNDVVCGLKYLHIVKRSGIKVDRMEEMIGSYGPRAEPFETKFDPEEAPSGM